MAQRPGSLLSALSQTNGWWRDPSGWSARDLDLRKARQAPYSYVSDAVAELQPGGLYLLRGPRRVGKSVAVKQAIESLIGTGIDPRRILHMSVDGWTAADLPRLVRAARSLMPDGGRRFWFIDEITTITDGWSHRIKWLRDNDPWFQDDTVVLTGSSSTDLSESIGILAGRRGRVKDADRILLPMGFRTFVRLAVDDEALDTAWGTLGVGDLAPENLGEAAYRLAPWLGALVDAWEIYLWVGGFHQSVTSYMTTRDVDEAFQHELFEVVDRDALRRASWSRTETAAFLHRLAKGLSSRTNQSKLASRLGVTPPTVKSRINDLRAAFVLWPCYRENGLRPQPRSQQKLYFTDPAYASLVPGAPPDFSLLSEQQLGMALARNIEKIEPGSFIDSPRVLHHRSGTGSEIDFVGPDFGKVAIESKYVDTGWGSPARTIGASPWRGIVATRSVLDLNDPDLMAVPTAMLAWLLDT